MTEDESQRHEAFAFKCETVKERGALSQGPRFTCQLESEWSLHATHPQSRNNEIIHLYFFFFCVYENFEEKCSHYLNNYKCYLSHLQLGFLF